MLFAHSEFASDDEGEELEEPRGTELWDDIKFRWDKRRKKLEHDYAIAGWALCVMPEIHADCVARYNGEHMEAVERVVRRLHELPMANTNPDVGRMSSDEIWETFLDEHKCFQKKLPPFDKEHKWNSQDAIEGRSYLWMEKHALKFTKVLGFVGCRVTSKGLGMGACERSWGDVKTIKTGKRAHISGASIEKRSILYTTACIEAARIRRKEFEKIDARGDTAMFGDDDIK